MKPTSRPRLGGEEAFVLLLSLQVWRVASWLFCFLKKCESKQCPVRQQVALVTGGLAGLRLLSLGLIPGPGSFFSVTPWAVPGALSAAVISHPTRSARSDLTQSHKGGHRGQ
jgi:hypothetical protein